MTQCLELDGAHGEGGGQVLRTSLALSLLTGRPFHLRNVRARRPRPGLQPQHLMSVRAAATIGQAAVRGESKGSCDLSFEPGEVRAGRYTFDIGTAGATGLVLHTVYLPLALRGDAPSELTLLGGTHNLASPCFHYLDATWRGYLEHIGLRVKLRLTRPGFYPRGGGRIDAVIHPCAGLRGVSFRDRGAVTVTGLSVVAGLPESIAQRQSRRAAQRLEKVGVTATIHEESWDGGPGTVLLLEASTTPAPTVFFGLGERGKPAERVADEAVDELLAYLAAEPALIDPHSADQLLLPLAVAEGPSEFRVSTVTRHLTTNAFVIRQFIERDITIDGAEGEPGTVRVS